MGRRKLIHRSEVAGFAVHGFGTIRSVRCLDLLAALRTDFEYPHSMGAGLPVFKCLSIVRFQRNEGRPTRVRHVKKLLTKVPNKKYPSSLKPTTKDTALQILQVLLVQDSDEYIPMP